jgi:hypothetical protein
MRAVDSSAAITKVWVQFGVGFDLVWRLVCGEMDVLLIETAYEAVENRVNRPSLA